MSTFVNGLALARTFYADVVGPLLDGPHAAGLIGEGSEVLGFDTERSTDHDWGPRLQIFVDAAEVERIRRLIDEALPDTHRGHSIRWYSIGGGTVTHHVEVDTAEAWLRHRLPTIPPSEPDTAAWLAIPQQHLLQLTAGDVFRDDLGVLTRIREIYRWFPPDVWRWIIATQWHLIGNATATLGRVIELGDQRGARVIIGRLCRLVMEMSYLLEQRYWPYDKWFDRGFAGLAASADLGPLLDAALNEPPRNRRDGPLPRALIELAERHNALGISAAVQPVISDFGVNIDNAVRPYPVLNTGSYIEAILDAIADVGLRNLPRAGTIDQLTHADDMMINFSGWPNAIADSYRVMLTAAATG